MDSSEINIQKSEWNSQLSVDMNFHSMRKESLIYLEQDKLLAFGNKLLILMQHIDPILTEEERSSLDKLFINSEKSKKRFLEAQNKEMKSRAGSEFKSSLIELSRYIGIFYNNHVSFLNVREDDDPDDFS